jgi:hypothetical protein
VGGIYVVEIKNTHANIFLKDSFIEKREQLKEKKIDMFKKLFETKI